MKPCPARPALAVCRPECAPVFGRLADTLRMRNRRVRLFPLVAALLLGLLVVSCTPEYIPNTDVEDTAENRGVISFCEEYRRAVEQRKIGLLVQLAAPSYYEDGGNVDATDDIDYAGLKDYLEDKFKQTKAIRYEIRYRKVTHGRKDHLLVDFTYSASYKIPTDKGDVWRRTVADNRLELVQNGDSYKILSGM